MPSINAALGYWGWASAGSGYRRHLLHTSPEARGPERLPRLSRLAPVLLPLLSQPAIIAYSSSS